MGTLDLIRNSTVESVMKAPATFDDLPKPVYRGTSAPKEMTRIVEGADDLRHPNAGRRGVVPSGFAPEPRLRDELNDVPEDVRSPGQIEVMASLHMQLGELDPEVAEKAVDYTTRMTVAGKWTRGREGNASEWIGRMIAKVRELKAIRAANPQRNNNGDDEFQSIPNGYYAVNDSGAPDDIHYFRISRFRDGGIKVQEQASDTLYPVRRGPRRTAILKTIQAVGWRPAQELYGRTIGRCGRCNRTLTDKVSRDRGIGPDCWDKM